jgi:hypothetical protein
VAAKPVKEAGDTEIIGEAVALTDPLRVRSSIRKVPEEEEVPAVPSALTVP